MPRKLSKTAQKLIELAPSMTNEELIDVFRATPDYMKVVRDNDKQEIVYPSDPVEFMRDTLGYQMWPKLEEICRSVSCVGLRNW
jgi:hypothetical protein